MSNHKFILAVRGLAAKENLFFDGGVYSEKSQYNRRLKFLLWGPSSPAARRRIREGVQKILLTAFPRMAYFQVKWDNVPRRWNRPSTMTFYIYRSRTNRQGVVKLPPKFEPLIKVYREKEAARIAEQETQRLINFQKQVVSAVQSLCASHKVKLVTMHTEYGMPDMSKVYPKHRRMSFLFDSSPVTWRNVPSLP